MLTILILNITKANLNIFIEYTLGKFASEINPESIKHWANDIWPVINDIWTHFLCHINITSWNQMCDLALLTFSYITNFKSGVFDVAKLIVNLVYQSFILGIIFRFGVKWHNLLFL